MDPLALNAQGLSGSFVIGGYDMWLVACKGIYSNVDSLALSGYCVPLDMGHPRQLLVEEYLPRHYDYMAMYMCYMWSMRNIYVIRHIELFIIDTRHGEISY